MKERDPKLTGSSEPRYDRSGALLRQGYGGQRKYMAENGAELLEPQIDPAVRAAWQPILAATPDPDERSSIKAAMLHGAMPTQAGIEAEMSTEEKLRALRQMSQKDADARFKQIKRRVENPREPTDLEKMVDGYVQEMKSDLKGGSQAPGEVLRKVEKEWEYPEGTIAFEEKVSEIKADWSEFDWNNGQIKEAMRALHATMGLDFDQSRVLLEILIAKGKKPTDLTQEELRRGLTEASNKLDGWKEKNQRDIANVNGNRKVLYLDDLGVDEEYTRRFIFEKDFHRENERHYQEFPPENIEDLAWQIMHSPEGTYDKYGPAGEFPLLEMRIIKDEHGNIDPEVSKYYVNQANMVRWVRDRMVYAYELNPDDAQQFFGSVKLTKKYGEISLGLLFGSPGNFFKSEDEKTEYDELFNQWVIEAWYMSTIRSWDVKYQENMGDSKALLENIQGIFASNALTKESFKSNLVNLMAILPLNFDGSRDKSLSTTDNTVGASWIDMYLAYYSLSDYESLQKIFGSGSSFFTRQGFDVAFQAIIKDKVGVTGAENPRGLGDAELHENYRKAFDENGEITTIENKDNFIELINFFGKKVSNVNAERTVREMMRNAVAEKYGGVLSEKNEAIPDENNKNKIVKINRYRLLTDQGKEDVVSLKMAEATAFSMVRFTGAGARNDTKSAGYDFLNKLMRPQTYRRKQSKTGDASGNEGTYDMFKELVKDLPTAVETTTIDQHGQTKTWLDVMWEIHDLETGYNLELKKKERELAAMSKDNKAEYESKQRDIREFKEEMSKAYQNKAAEFEFKRRALSNWTDDHLKAANQVFELITTAEEVEMEKYVQHQTWGGVSFKREEFQKDVQNKMIHPIRYFIKTYPDLHFNRKIRALDQTATIKAGKPVYRDMPLAEAMFGHELLNREAFWKRDSRGRPINQLDARGLKMKGIYEIDYDKLQTDKGKELIWKQFFMVKLAADLHAHRKFHAPDNSFDLNYYNSVIKAIEAIPAAVKSDEYSLTDQVREGSFFNKNDMKWFRRSIKVENYDLFVRGFFKDIALPEDPQEGIGILLALSILSRQIVKSGS